MFTGIIEEIGTVKSISKRNDFITISISSNKAIIDCKRGDSIAVNGVCLTAIEINANSFTAEAVKETIQKTNLKFLKSGSPVNLEKALTINTLLGGHIVQGHVDQIGTIEKIKKTNNNIEIIVKANPEITNYIVDKASITVNGISLTVSKVGNSSFSLSIIPTTFKDTTFKFIKIGDTVNLEVDILGKYIYNYLNNFGILQQRDSKLTKEYISTL